MPFLPHCMEIGLESPINDDGVDVRLCRVVGSHNNMTDLS